MTLRKHNGHTRIATIVLANLAILAVGIQTARMPVAASSTHRTSGTMAGMMMGAAASAGKNSGPVSMLHRSVVRLMILNYKFSPAQVIVSPGTRIIWTNKDGDPHTVRSTTNVWSSDALDTDGTFARTFSKAGSFPYYCSIHPFMKATIIVKK